jgi:hypothetical protein
VRKHAIRQHDWAGAITEFRNAMREVASVSMPKGFDRAMEHACGIDERGVREIVDERMAEFSSERLRGGHGREVAIGKNNGGFDTEKHREHLLKLGVNFVIPGGEARGGYIESNFIKSGASCRSDEGMPRQAKIIAAGKVKERPISPTDFIRTHQLQWLRSSHARMIGFARRNCTRECSPPAKGLTFSSLSNLIVPGTKVNLLQKI